ncbi:MAG: helix-turn-helix domain-containing protein [Gemmatimonas sp.]
MTIRLATVREIAPILRVTARTAYRMAAEGRLPGLVKRKGSDMRVNLRVFEAHFTPEDSPPAAA